jgi:hypothetical protein
VTTGPEEFQDYDVLPRDVGELLSKHGISLGPADAKAILLRGGAVRLVQEA